MKLEGKCSVSTALQHKHHIWGLVISAILIILLWQIPIGRQITYPFSILATWFHEMSHGLTALALGGQFADLTLYPSGSGIARYTYNDSLLLGQIGHAMIAASGPLGPVVAGAVFIRMGYYPYLVRWGLFLLSSILLISVIIWIRSSFGILMILGIGFFIGLIAIIANHYWQQFILQFLGVQACISSYQSLDYLFTYQVTIANKNMLSDTGQIAHYLGLSYWFWAILIIIFSIWLLFISLNPPKNSAKKSISNPAIQSSL